MSPADTNTPSEAVADRGAIGPRQFPPLAIAVLISLLTAALFSRALTCDFVDFDDDLYVTGNARVQEGLTPETFAWVWSATVGVQWYPLTLMSHLFDVSLFGLDPAGHHATSVALHALNAGLLFMALRALTGHAWPSAIVAALFAVHPLRVESVAWIAERKDVLSGLFWMLGLWAYAGYGRAPRVGGYLLVLLVFACGLMSKPMVVTFPCVLLLLDYWPLQRMTVGPGQRIRRVGFLVAEKLPLFALAAAAGVATVLTQSAGGAMASWDASPLWTRILNALGAYAVYVWQTVWPANLAVTYPMPPAGLLETRALAGLLLIAGCSGLAWYARAARPYLLVGGLWYLGTLVPVIGLVQVGAQSHADRYTYLPQIGLFVALVWLARDISSRKPALQRLAAGTAGVVMVAYGAITAIQIGSWETSETLFARALAVTTENARAENGYGRALLDSGHAAESVPYMSEATRIEPGFVYGWRDLARAQLEAGDAAAALETADASLIRFPENAGLLSVSGRAALSLGFPDHAVGRFEQFVALEPESVAGWVNLGIGYGQLGKWEAARRSLDRAVSLDRSNVDALYNLGALHLAVGEREPARERFREVLRLNPEYVAAREQLAALEDG